MSEVRTLCLPKFGELIDVRVSDDSLVGGYWLVVTGWWLLVGGYWLVVTGWWLLVGGYWLVVTGWWLPMSGVRTIR
jgi:hypothetical protein